MKDFYINIREESCYPSPQYDFDPDQMYPEYYWGEKHIAKEKNYVYEMVRDCLIGLELNKNNVGNKNWNPFSEIIKENETVLIKPNWVFHQNENKRVKNNSIECLVTHPSVIRAIVDYVLIALNGTGKIIIGDAPMLGCNLDKLLANSGYDKLFAFYRQFSYNIQPMDFRNCYSISGISGVTKKRVFNETDYIEVDLGTKSKHYYSDNQSREYKVSDYSKKETTACHNGVIHKYYIAKDVLLSDVVINISKPKCHRLSGITASLKNIVGIINDKVCLPHRTIGSKQEGGDEYLNKSSLKKAIAQVQESQVFLTSKRFYIPSLIFRYIYGAFYYIMKFRSRDKYLVGSWYGNDTIWRTVFDLNYILLYADKEGKIKNSVQRKVFNVADMIIAGEGNGPVSPEPKHLGLILAGYNSVISDKIICKIMGFSYKKVPGLEEAINFKEFSIKDQEEYSIASNKPEYNNKKIDELHFPMQWQFKPYETWQGRIEK